MINKQNIKGFELIFLVAIILLVGTAAFISLNKNTSGSEITGFAVAEDTTNEGNTTTTNETAIINETSVNETAAEETIDENKTAPVNETTEVNGTETEEVPTVPGAKTISINLEYKSGTIYDPNDDGMETTEGVIDFTVENSNFNWDVDFSKLCTKWETYSADNDEITTVCYGSDKCCGFINLVPTSLQWDESFLSAYTRYGASFNNIISAQVLYVDYTLSVDEPFAEIYNSEWAELTANYFLEYMDFKNICIDTCSIEGFNETFYNLIFEIEGDGAIRLDTLTYTLIETIGKVRISLAVEDNERTASGNYRLYKDNVLVIPEEGFVAPDYYDIEIIPEENIVERLVIYKANITEPLTASIGIDNVSRYIEIEDVEIKKKYAIDASELQFENAILTAVAAANSLYKCKDWDYETEYCYGTWIKIKDIVEGEEYELTITPDDPGFIEGNLNVTVNVTQVNITPVNITEFVLIKDIPNITITKNNDATLDLSQYFSNIDSDTIFSYYEQDNITILFKNNIATITPDTDFIGTRYTYIKANKSDSKVISNVFSITVKDIVAITNITIKNVTINVFDDHQWAFYYWKKAQLEGQVGNNNVLIHIDQHNDNDGVSELPPEDITLQDLEDYVSDSENIVDYNFISPAVYDGTISEIYWVAPTHIKLGDDIWAYKLEGNSLTLTQDIEEADAYVTVHKIHSLKQLPDISNKNILLDFDLDYYIPALIIDGYEFNQNRFEKQIDDLRKTVSWLQPEVITIATSSDYSDINKIESVKTTLVETLEQALNETIAYPFKEKLKVTSKLQSKKPHFKMNEDAVFEFEYLTEEELDRQGKSKEKSIKPKQTKKWVVENESVGVFVYDNNKQLKDIDVEIEELREGKFNINLIKGRSFKAGKYTLEIKLLRDGIQYIEEQDFLWGVLVINTHKSIYLENEDAFIGIAVLDDQGRMVCDADVTLEITDPLGDKKILSTDTGTIKISPECEVYGVTNLPDYYADYIVSGIGNYIMNLTAITSNGIRTITDGFEVRDSVDFDIARDGPTRIYPPVSYVMRFTINANKNYNGDIVEYVPASFVITPQDGLTITTVKDTKVLRWNINLKKDDVVNLAYEFDAPNISPYLFTLGALEIGAFKEIRNWMIASDLTGDEVIFPAEGADTTHSASGQLGASAVLDLADEDATASGATVSKSETLYAVLNGLSNTPTSVNTASCTIHYATDGSVSGGHSWEVLTAPGGTQVATEDDAAMGTGAQTHVTRTLSGLESLIDETNVNTMQVIIHGESDRGPGIITVDWINCTINYEYTPAANIPPNVEAIINSSPANLNRTNSTLWCYNTSQFDSDSDDEIIVTWNWYKDLVITADTTQSIAASSTTKEDSWICQVNAADSSDTNSTNSTALVILNSAPFINATVPNIAGSEGVAWSNPAINCTDVDGDTLTYYVNDTVLSVNSGTGELFDTPTESEAGVWTINASCGDGTVFDNQTFTYTVTEGIAPRWQSPQNNASTVTRKTGYVNWSVDITDLGGLSSYIFSFNDTGAYVADAPVEISGSTSNISVVKQIATATRDKYVCGNFTFNDTSDNWNSTSLSCFTVDNSPPAAANTISPSTTHDLTQSMSWTEGTDADSGAVSTYWCVGTAADICDVHAETEIADPPYAFEGGELNYGGASKTYYFNLTSYDGADRGTVYKSTFTLTNAQPSAPSNTDTVTTHSLNPTITFDKGTDTDTSPADTVTQFVSVDASGYADTGDTHTESGDINSFAPTLDYSGESRTYYVRIYANDTTGATNERSANYEFTLALTNDYPNIEVIINSYPSNENKTNSTLWCFNISTSDPDGDDVAISYEWYKNDVLQTSLTSNTVAASNTIRGEGWVCQVNATDGYLSNRTNSTTLTILNSPPFINGTVPDIAGSAGTAWSNPAINCTDVDGDAITYYVNDTVLAVNSGTGELSDTPTESEAGTYSINASCDDGTMNASQIFTYTVNDATAPVTTLNYPPAGYYNDTSDPYSIRFNCSATDGYQLLNISLFITNRLNQSFALNRTANISSTYNSTNWTVSLVNGNYTWNCLTYDLYNNSNWGVNKTILINSTVSNNPPIVFNVNWTSTSASGDLVEGSITSFTFTFNVSDQQGFTDINHSLTKINLTLGSGEANGLSAYNNSNCTITNYNTNYIYYSCTVLFNYYYNASSEWVVNASVTDNSGETSFNDTMRFTVNSLTAMTLANAAINFTGGVTTGAQDVAADAPLVINNTGNFDFTIINITAKDLIGRTTAEDIIPALNITVNITAASGTRMDSSRPVTIPDAILTHGEPNIGNMSLFFYVDVPSGLSAQVYNSSNWEIVLE